MIEKQVLKIPEIPKGSRLEKYIVDRIVKISPEKLPDFFFSLFKECSSFVRSIKLESAI